MTQSCNQLEPTAKNGPKSRPIRVLLSAFSCKPEAGSEGGVGWGRAIETARLFDTWVLCGEDEAAIKRWFTLNGDIPNLHFCFVPIYRFDRLMVKIPGLLYFFYRVWQLRAYRMAVELDREIHFDIVHQYNIGTYREPGYLWKLDLPFIWGPVGGIENYPWRFLRKAGVRGALSEAVRNVMNALQFRFSNRVRCAAKKAGALITVNSTGQQGFKQLHGVRTILMPDIGATEVFDSPPTRSARQGPMRILWNGTFLHRKALHLLIEALAKLPPSCRYELRILGRGPLEKRWRRLINRVGIEAHCRWMPWLPREEALAQYRWADVLVFTSLRDASGSVVMESLSQGLPVICFDHQGVGDIVTAQCGIKVPVTNPTEVVQHLGDAIISLERNREKLDELAVAALERARDYLWTRKVEQTAEIYQQVLKKRLINTGLPLRFSEKQRDAYG